MANPPAGQVLLTHTATQGAGGDIEQGTKVGISQQVDNILKNLYIGPYILSVVTFVVGGYMVFFPPTHKHTDLFRTFSGTLLFVCGSMLMMNNDLIVTTIRMWIQLQFFKKNNQKLSGLVSEHGEQVKALEIVKTGLQQLNDKFDGDLNLALRSIRQLEAATQDHVRSVVSLLAKWYFDKNHDGSISDGPELETAMEVMHDFFGNAPIDFNLRKQEFRKTLDESETWKASKSMDTEDFTTLLVAMLTAPVQDNGIAREVNRLIVSKGLGKGSGRISTAQRKTDANTDIPSSGKGVGKGRGEDRSSVGKEQRSQKPATDPTAQRG